MNAQKDSPSSAFLLRAPLPDRATLSIWLHDAVQVDARLEDLASARERWRQQGITEVPKTAKVHRRKAFAALSQLAPGALAELPRLSVEACRERAQRYAHLAQLDIDSGPLSSEDRALILRVLTIAAWKHVLHSSPDAADERRRERVVALVDKWTATLGFAQDCA